MCLPKREKVSQLPFSGGKLLVSGSVDCLPAVKQGFGNRQLGGSSQFSKSPNWGCSLPNGLNGFSVVVTNYLLTGMILQEPTQQLTKLFCHGLAGYMTSRC